MSKEISIIDIIAELLKDKVELKKENQELKNRLEKYERKLA